MFDGDERLLGCGCAAGSILKCFAVEERLRGQNVLGPLVSALTQDHFSVNRYDLFVVTRLKKHTPVRFVRFFEVAHTDAIALLENQPDGARLFAEQCFQNGDEAITVGAIVMNIDPFTKGHRYLIETAAAQCDALHVFEAEEYRSVFPADDWFRMFARGPTTCKMFASV